MRIVRAALTSLALMAGIAINAPAGAASADVPATNPIQFISHSFWSDSDSLISSGTLNCPSGSRIVSSGASSAGQLVGIIPSYDYTSATATARYYGYMSVTIGCEKVSQMSEVTSNTAVAVGTGFRRAVAYCPAGYRAFGGGGAFIGPFGRQSTDSYWMTSNAVTQDGTGWTFAATTYSKTDVLYVRTQCAPLRGSVVASNSMPFKTDYTAAYAYAQCWPGYKAVSGGAYMSKSDGTEVQNGIINSSVPANKNQWYAQGTSYDGNVGTQKLVSLTQCIR